MSGDRPFLDTNVLVYAFAEHDPRAEIAGHALNELVSVAVRKLLMPWEEVLEALGALRVLCPSPVPVTLQLHEVALQIVEKHGYPIDIRWRSRRRSSLDARFQPPGTLLFSPTPEQDVRASPVPTAGLALIALGVHAQVYLLTTQTAPVPH